MKTLSMGSWKVTLAVGREARLASLLLFRRWLEELALYPHPKVILSRREKVKFATDGGLECVHKIKNVEKKTRMSPTVPVLVKGLGHPGDRLGRELGIEVHTPFSLLRFPQFWKLKALALPLSLSPPKTDSWRKMKRLTV